MGLLGVTVSSEYGGVELGYFQHTLAMEAISEASGSVALSYGGACRLLSISFPSPLPPPGHPMVIELVPTLLPHSPLEPLREPGMKPSSNWLFSDGR